MLFGVGHVSLQASWQLVGHPHHNIDFGLCGATHFRGGAGRKSALTVTITPRPRVLTRSGWITLLIQCWHTLAAVTYAAPHAWLHELWDRDPRSEDGLGRPTLCFTAHEEVGLRSQREALQQAAACVTDGELLARLNRRHVSVASQPR